MSESISIQLERIGIQNLFFGLVSTEFMQCQKIFYSEHQFGRNFTYERWGRWIVRSVLDFTLELWKFRCTLMHEKQHGTMENRLRNLAEGWLSQLQNNPTLIPFQSRHLLNRSKNHFRKGDIRSVNAWIRRVDMELKTMKVTPDASDIRKYFKPKGAENVTQDIQSDNLNDPNPTDISVTSDEYGYNSDTDASDVAVRDLLADDDTIATFPNYYRMLNYSDSTSKTTNEHHDNIPCILSVLYSGETDLYANIRYHKRVKKCIFEETSDEESVG